MKEKEIDLLSNREIKKALLKRAMGFDAKEVIEEYVGEDDGVKLTKKKVTYKFLRYTNDADRSCHQCRWYERYQ